MVVVVIIMESAVLQTIFTILTLISFQTHLTVQIFSMLLRPVVAGLFTVSIHAWIATRSARDSQRKTASGHLVSLQFQDTGMVTVRRVGYEERDPTPPNSTEYPYPAATGRAHSLNSVSVNSNW
ncbi:hypothetical protein DFH07DRAFT_968753 [Mycena maculata]|uniref:Uncharacterized protein n=1 Tax=Mycena maculata TaxID=230809 RepID=A0AAD7MSN4_9AGAR|nr:hypothetical protein DFH07DRAFT_968753 [Mycena maculata]